VVILLHPCHPCAINRLLVIVFPSVPLKCVNNAIFIHKCVKFLRNAGFIFTQNYFGEKPAIFINIKLNDSEYIYSI
jgi:hypothetical protein